MAQNIPDNSHIYYPSTRRTPTRFERRFPRTVKGVMTVVITWPIWGMGLMMVNTMRKGGLKRKNED
jgi:hypothetical protein